MGFCHSDDRERFSGEYETREEALEAGRDAYPDATTIYTGEVVPFDRETLARLAVENMIDWLTEHMSDEAGEAAEDQPEISDEDHDALNEHVREVLSKPGVIRCWSVAKIREHMVERV